MAYITNKVKNVQGTSIYITDAISQGALYEGVNNITQTNTDLPFVLDLSYYSQENPYKDIIYSQDDVNDIKIWFNDIELENAGEYVETLTRTARILPNDSKKRFSLNNFVAQELDLTIHDISLNTIQDQVKISIGTLVDNSYEYVPIGIFNIQDTPVNNHDKYVIKLRDNRVKFDFNYNAQPLIERLGGVATKKQILDDICLQADVENGVLHFDGENDEIGIYDSTISANRYVPYLAEQAGNIATIDRYGKLKFVDLSNLYVWRIPLSLMSDDYKLGSPFEIKRVVYESGVIKYETSSDETLDTLYLDSSNPYINSQEQIDNIFAKLENFKIDSVTTNNFLGNPAIDPYDIIEVYDDYAQEQTVVFRTFANMFYTFNGKHLQNIDTQIGVEARTENVTKNSEATFRKWAKTEIDNNEAKINLESGRIDEIGGSVSQLEIDNTSINARIQTMSTNIDDEGNITEITTVNGYTFNKDGLNIYTSDNDFNTQITNIGVYFKDGNTSINQTTKDGTITTNLQQKGLHQYSYNGDSYDFSNERVEVEYVDEDGVTQHKIGYATFYNGGV